ncbi:MAG: thymidine kinase [Clostridia bacterium]|jgi:thymidine kinase|nr:thymidine kinase [Clostridia bacterium]
MAKLFLRYAVMNAGKSTQLLQIAYDYEKNNGKNVLCLKPQVDTKADKYIISRLENGVIRRKADFLTHPQDGWIYDKIYDEKIAAEKNGKPFSLILIDEAQFMSKENIFDLARVVTYLNVPVICFALKVDAFGIPFEGSSYLFGLAQDIEEVTTRAICRFSDTPKKATIHLRTIDGVPVFEGEQVSIEDDREIRYKPICLAQYMKRYDEAKGIIRRKP